MSSAVAVRGNGHAPARAGVDAQGWRVLDGAGRVVSSRGMAMAKARQMLFGRFAYRGAAVDRQAGNWSVSGGSADADLLPDRMELIKRSRERLRNDPLASGAIDCLVKNVIGPGFRVKTRVDGEVLGLSKEQTIALNRRIDAAWRSWIREADYGGNEARRLNFYQLQVLAYRQMLETGERWVFPRYERRPGAKYLFSIQLVEGDVVTGGQQYASRDANAPSDIRDGIEVGLRGEEVAAYISDVHPGEYGSAVRPSKSRRLPSIDAQTGRANYWHSFRAKRPGGTRGEPVLAPVLMGLRQLSGYLGSEITRAEMAAMWGLMILQAENTNPFADALDTSESDSYQPDGVKRVEHWESGMVHYGMPGDDVKVVSGNVPPPNFESFVEKIATILGSPLGLTRELMLNSFDKSNFSNTRAALLSSQRGFEIVQLSEIADFVEPIRERFVEELWLRGDLQAGFGALPQFEDAREAYLGARYIKPGWPWIDPYKDVQKSKMAIEAGLSTFQREFGDRGLDWETELTQLADEHKFIIGHGLPVDFVVRGMAPGIPAEDETDRSEADGADDEE